MITNRDWPVIAENEAEEFPSKMRSIVQGLAEFTDEANALGGELNTARDQGVQTIEQARDQGVQAVAQVRDGAITTIQGHEGTTQGYRDDAQQSASSAQGSADLAEQAKLAAQAAAAGDVIDDSVVSSVKTYSSEKTEALVAAQIDDGTAATNKTYSSLKMDQIINTEIKTAKSSLTANHLFTTLHLT